MIIEALRDFLRRCPLLENNRMNVDFLGNKAIEYTVDIVPGDTVVKRYVDSATLKQLHFVFASRNYYGPDIAEQIENSGFYEKFTSWIDEQNKKGSLPILQEGKTAMEVICITSGYLFDATVDSARYQIQCRLVYYEKGR